MPEKVVPGPVSHEERSIREAVCVHTKKIFDSCKEEDTAPLIFFNIKSVSLNFTLCFFPKSLSFIYTFARIHKVMRDICVITPNI